MIKILNYLLIIPLLFLYGCNPLATSEVSKSEIDSDFAAYLEAPGAFSLNSPSSQSGQISFSWSASQRADTYEVKYGTSSGVYPTTASCTSSPCTITGLVNGTTYYVTASASNLSGQTSASNELSITPTGSTVGPSVPSGLAATATSGSVALSWTASTGPGTITYNVLRSTTSGSGYSAIATSQTGTTYTDSTVTNGTSYYYVVSATNAGGTSANSSEVSAAPIATPSVPAGLSATATSGSVALSWTASSGSGTITYNVLRSTSSGSGYTSIATAQSGATYTDSTVTNGTTYYYVVSASNAGGTSANSSQVSAAPIAIPSVPAGLAATATSGSVALSWSASTGSGTITYNVLRSTTSGSGYTSIATAQSGTSYTDSTVTNGTIYYYVVSATNAGGTSANSSQVSAAPIAAPSAPSGLARTSANGSVTLSWTASTGPGTITYNVLRSTTSGSGYSAIATSQTGTTYTDSTVTNGTTYYYVVSGTSAGGTSANSSEVSAAPIAIPSVPAGLAATATSGSVALSWSASTGSGTITYNVLRSTTSGSGYTSIATAQSGTSYTDSTVTNGTTYYYVVSATNAGGTSANSSEVSAAPIAIPSVPAGLAATATSGSVALSWSASTGSGTITYNILRSTTSGSGYSSIATAQSGATYTDSTVTNGTTYYYVVNSTNAGGTSANSSEVSAAPIAIPSIPAGLGATATSGSVALSWSASTGSGTITYNILRSTTSGSGYSAIATAQSGTTYTDSTVSNGTTYYYVVSASNAGGSSSNSSQMSALPMLPPLTPTGLTATGAQSNIQLNWTATSGLGTITYNVLRSTTSGSGYSTIASAQSGTTYSDLTALNGTTYYYVVSATNAGGTSSNSSEVSATALGSFSISAVAVNGGSALQITWGTSTGATSYTLKYGTTSATYTTTLTSQTSPTTITGLTAGTTYYFMVTAVNASGSIDASGESSGIPMAAFAMSAATSASTSSSVSWASSTGATSYTLKYGIATGTYGTTFSTSATSPTTVTGLTGATTYYYRVTAVNASGSLDSSAEISQTTTLAIDQPWPFDATPNPALTYAYDSSLVEFTGDKVQLTGSDQVDDSDTTSGFAGGTAVGAMWDNSNSYLRLDQSGSPLNNASLNSSWSPAHSSLVNYWKMDNNWNDSVGTSNGTAAGDAAFTSNAKVGSYGGIFDGLGDYVSVGTLGNFGSSRGSGFSVAFWVKTTDSAGCDSILGHLPASRNSLLIDVNCSHSGSTASGRIRARIGSDEGTAKILSGGTTTTANINNGNWNHVVVSMTPSTNTIAIYVNGISRPVSYGTQATPAIFANFASAVFIGANTSTPTQQFTGEVDDLAIYSVVLTETQAVSLYNRQVAKYSGSLTSRVMDAIVTGASWTTLTWTPTLPFAKEIPITNELQTNYTSLVSSSGTSGDSSLATNLVGLWKLNEASWNGTAGEVVDATGTSNGVSVNSATTIDHGKFRKAGSFNGTNQYVSLGAGNLVTGSSITLSAWIYQPSATAYDPIIAKNDGNNSKNAYALIVNTTTGSGDVLFRISSTGSSWTAVQTAAGVISTNAWYHIAATYNAGTYHIYVNGVDQSLTIANSSTLVTGSIQSNDVPILIGGATYISNAFQYFPGFIDDVAIWSRELNGGELKQIYRRGANQIKYQVRNCTAANCSDDFIGANWKGPDGTNQSYFSELYNMSTQSASPSGTTNSSLPSMLFSNFSAPVGTSRYFQYRTIMESDDTGTSCNYGSGATWCSPELKSVTVDPIHYPTSSPTVISKTGVSYTSLTSFAQTLGSGSCTGLVYNLGVGASYGAATWYWWNGSAWASTTANDPSEANSESTINTNISSFAGPNTVYFRAFLKSSGTSKCELDHLRLIGVL